MRKKCLIIVIAALIVFSVVGCDNTAKGKLNSEELLLYEAMIKVSEKHLTDSASMRLLEIYCYNRAEEDSPLSSSVVAKIQSKDSEGKLQQEYLKICIVSSEELKGENLETYNHLLELYETSDPQILIITGDLSICEARDLMMDYKAEAGDYIGWGYFAYDYIKFYRDKIGQDYENPYEHLKEWDYESDCYNPEYINQHFDIAKINKAFIEYWESMGLSY